jgi:hypothetical protein
MYIYAPPFLPLFSPITSEKNIKKGKLKRGKGERKVKKEER